MQALPSFEDFYRAIRGRDPFPWQRRLADLVVSSAWPEEVGVPTGLGKTSTLDIAVWSLAAQAELAPHERRAPVRIWYVVNRRILVDAASDQASTLEDQLVSSSNAAVRAVADRLRSIEGGVTNRPLSVSRLRGGSALDARPPHPAQPAIICATVPMFASRLLFQSYGTGKGVRPIEAALAGADSLLLLDEAHLAPTLRSLMADLIDCDARRAGILRWAGRFSGDPRARALPTDERAYPSVVSLTATGDGAARRFDLDEADLAHPVVRERLSATKPTRVEAATSKNLAQVIADRVVEIGASNDPGHSILVFVNRPATARQVVAQLRPKLLKHDWDLLVLTGHFRGLDAERVRSRLLDSSAGIPADRPGRGERTLVVVATQTLEVGADLDADHLVTESAGVRALTQRFGRLNRLGRRPWATASIVHPSDVTDRLYGDDAAEAVRRIEAAQGFDDSIDLCPARITDVLGRPGDSPPEAPALLPFHLWEWSKTSVAIAGEAPIEPFYEGFGDPDVGVAVAWRWHLDGEGSAVYPSIHHMEWVEVPLWEARGLVERTECFCLDSDSGLLREISPDRLKPGGRIVVPCGSGGYADSGFDAESTAPVEDLSPLLTGAVRLDRLSLERFVDRPLSDAEVEAIAVLGDEEADDADDDTNLATFWAVVEAVVAGHDRGARPAAIDRVGAEAVPWLRWTTPKESARTAVDALDEVSIAPTATLEDHLAGVGEVAARIARAIGLPEWEAEAVRIAGRLHDLGKADPRFQRWLTASPDTLMAKSSTTAGRWQQRRTAAGWPAGARHELLSLQVLDAAIEAGMVVDDEDLVRHLVVSHHGHGRPWVPLSESTTGASLKHRVVVAGIDADCDLDPSKPDWGQPARFRQLSERYGFWGLALLEAIVRQADHVVSAVTEVQ